MFIDSIGNIGIGATYPTAKLEISGTGNNNNATLLRFVGAETEPQNYSLSFDKIFTDGNGYPIYDWQLNQRQYNGNYGNVLTIYRNGFVGINNTTPTFRLHVNGTIKGTNVMYDYSLKSARKKLGVNLFNFLEKFCAFFLKFPKYTYQNGVNSVTKTSRLFCRFFYETFFDFIKLSFF